MHAEPGGNLFLRETPLQATNLTDGFIGEFRTGASLSGRQAILRYGVGGIVPGRT